MIELHSTMNFKKNSVVPNDGCMVINMLADPNNREYELWEDGVSFAIGRSGNHRGVAMRLNITALATYCQMHQLTYKTEDENETEAMFGSLEEIINDLNAEQQVQHCRLVNMEELKVYIYWKKLQKFTDEKGYILLDAADMPEGDYFVEPFISETFVTGCNPELMSERLIWLRSNILHKNLTDFASDISVPTEMYAQFEEGTFQLPLIVKRIMNTYPWVDENWLLGCK